MGDHQQKILCVVGSLRSGSVNAATARAALGASPSAATLSIADIRALPLYNGDIEADGDPAAVAGLKAEVEAADGLIFFTPEYNGSFPAVTKNAIDWLSRKGTREEAPIKNVPITAVATTPGRRAGAGVLGHFHQIAPHLSNRYFGETLGIGAYGTKFDNGVLTDQTTLGQLQDFLLRFVAFVAGDSPPTS